VAAVERQQRQQVEQADEQVEAGDEDEEVERLERQRLLAREHLAADPAGADDADEARRVAVLAVDLVIVGSFSVTVRWMPSSIRTASVPLFSRASTGPSRSVSWRNCGRTPMAPTVSTTPSCVSDSRSTATGVTDSVSRVPSRSTTTSTVRPGLSRICSRSST
jgi:hypothetical protein